MSLSVSYHGSYHPRIPLQMYIRVQGRIVSYCFKKTASVLLIHRELTDRPHADLYNPNIIIVIHGFFQYLLKNDPRTFDDKQFQMYLFGSLITCVMAMLQRPVSSDLMAPILTMRGKYQKTTCFLLHKACCN
jgi:hypothetical protein